MIIAPGNGGVDQLSGERFAAPADVLEALKIVTGGKADNLSGRIVVEIPEKDLKTIGIKTERDLGAQLPLDMNAILPRLFATNGGITTCFFCLNHGNRPAILAKQHIITELMPFVFGALLLHSFGQINKNIELLHNLCWIVHAPASLQ